MVEQRRRAAEHGRRFGDLRVGYRPEEVFEEMERRRRVWQSADEWGSKWEIPRYRVSVSCVGGYTRETNSGLAEPQRGL